MTQRSALAIRDARPLDAGACGEILGQSIRDHRWMPVLHSGAEDIAHVGRMIELGWVRVAADSVIRGFLAREGAYVHALYVARGSRGAGVGRRLVEDALRSCGRIELHTFQANAGARRFYARMGFTEVETSDGAHNDEGLPDVRLVLDATIGAEG